MEVPRLTTGEYEDYVTSRCQPFTDLNYCIVALNGEAGEVAEWHKKYNLRGNILELTKDDLKEELGDVLFYLTRLASLEGWSLQDVMEANKAKLDDRVAKGFKQVG